MIKKYFALSLIAASVAVAGCSDDDDDDENGNNGGGTPVAVTAGVGGSVYDTIFHSTEHSQLLAAIDEAGLAAILDDESQDYTVFAPNNTAFNALTETPTGADLLRVLDFHVVEGTYDSVALTELVGLAAEGTDASLPTLLDDASLTFTIDSVEGQGLAVNGNAILQADIYPPVAEATTTEDETVTDEETTTEDETTTVDETTAGEETNTTEETTAEVAAPTGVVHSIGAVLTPPAAEEPTVPVEPPVVTDGDVDAALAADGNYEIFRSAINRDFAGNLESSAWTVFVPNDADLGTAGLSDLTVAQQQAHIVSSAALDPTALAAETTVTASNQTAYTVATVDGVTTVDGKEVNLIATGAAGAQVYSIAGVLGAAE